MLVYEIRALSGVGLCLFTSNFSDLGGGFGVAAPRQGALVNSASTAPAR